MTFTAWRTVFFLGGAVWIAGGTIYLIFIQAKVQGWNFVQSEDEEKETKNVTAI